MPKNESKNPLKNLLVGGAAASLEASVTYPVDFIKTELQLHQLGKAGAPPFKGMIGCAVWTVQNKGFFSLYRGMSTLVIGAMPKGAVRFAAFGQLKSLLSDEKGKLSVSANLFAGLGAGIAEAVIAVVPQESIKTKLIHDQSRPQPKYKGLVHCVKTILAEEGIHGIYRGVLPTCLKQGFNQAVRFSVYEQTTAFFNTNYPLKKGEERHFAVGMGIGAVAGLVSVYATMPFDVIKTRMQGLEAAKYKTTLNCLTTIVQQEGVWALWRGSIPRLSRVMCSTSLQFTFYEHLMAALNPIWPEP